MPLAGDDTLVEIEGEAVWLRPSLRAGLRLERQHGGFAPLLQAFDHGNVTAIASIIAETGHHPCPISFLTQPGAEPLVARLARIAPALIALVLDLADVAPAHEIEPDPEAPTSSGRTTLADAYSDLFGIATGVLGWSPADAWSSTPAEIHAALASYMDLNRAQNGLPPLKRTRSGPDDDVLDSAGLDSLRSLEGAV